MLTTTSLASETARRLWTRLRWTTTATPRRSGPSAPPGSLDPRWAELNTVILSFLPCHHRRRTTISSNAWSTSPWKTTRSSENLNSQFVLYCTARICSCAATLHVIVFFWCVGMSHPVHKSTYKLTNETKLKSI